TLHCSDASFYYYTDASGRVAALGQKDDSHKILEYYRYRAFGEMITLPVVDEPTIIEEEEIPADGIEDTPTSLTDNNASMLTLRGTYGSFVGRVSFWGNEVRALGIARNSVDGVVQTWRMNGYIDSIGSQLFLGLSNPSR